VPNPTGLAAGRDNRGNTVIQALYPSGLTDDQGNNLYNLSSAIRPTEVGGLGAYSLSMITGTLPAGLGAASIISAFRWAPSTSGALALIKRVALGMTSLGTGFTAGVGLLNLMVCRSFSANDTGGTAATLTTNNGKRRTSFGTTQVADWRIASTAALGAGTRTPDAQTLAQAVFGVVVATNTVMLPTTAILQADQSAGDWPLVLANNEGFEIQATVPATGTWQMQMLVDWLEVPAF